MKHTAFVLGLGCLVFATPSHALEHAIGEPAHYNGMEIAAVYLQPIEMAPAGMMRAAAESDIHLEADIHADNKNVNGFEEGMWMPYLNVHYALKKVGDKFESHGPLMAMVASDGPHYGDNVKLAGPGKYKLTFWVGSPESTHPQASEHTQPAHFGRHTDKETGVAPWFTPFTVEYDFTYAGTGKKGSY